MDSKEESWEVGIGLGQRIRQLRKQQGWFQKDLAGRIRSSVQAISNWEQDRAVPDSINRKKLAQAFGITEGDLFVDRATLEGVEPVYMILKQLGYTPDDLSALVEEDWKVIQRVVGPLIDELLERRGLGSPQKEQSRKTSSVFIVDDEVKLCHTLAGALRDRGFTVDFAFNGQAAIEKLLTRKEKPDLILLDLRMPLLNGAQFLQKFRRQNTDSKIIVLTGYPQDVVDLHVNELKIEGYFEKPFDMAAVIAKVEDVLR